MSHYLGIEPKRRAGPRSLANAAIPIRILVTPMGEVVPIQKQSSTRRSTEKRQSASEDYVRGQQVLADAIFHWKNDAGEDARAAVKLLMHHLATQFRADDAPLQPQPVKGESPRESASAPGPA